MIKNRVSFILCICALALVVSSLFYFQNKSRIATEADFSSNAPEAAASSVRTYRGPIDDCFQNALLYKKNNHLSADCTGNYVHFYPDDLNIVKAEKTTGDLRIGSFNLFHLGDNQAPMKHLGLVAKIINQWDVVGGQELMPLPGEWADANQKIFGLLAQGIEAAQVFPSDDWSVAMPGYMRLLIELRNLDPSWAVILQPVPQGEGPSGEMAGFYYRSSKVRLKEWGYCPVGRSIDVITGAPAKNYACLLQIPADQRELMSRVAFSAYFQSGNFDFIGVTTHVRFRSADNDEDLNSQKVEVCKSHVNPEKCKPPKDEVGRFYEVMAIAKQFKDMKQIARDNDIIFSGDFNLEDLAKSKDYWLSALNEATGFEVMQSELTTLSIKSAKMISNYDHFVLDPKASSECDMSSIRAFDFTTADTSSDPVMKDIAQFLKPAMQDIFLQEMNNKIKTFVKFQAGRGKKESVARVLNEKEQADLQRSYREAVVRMRTNKYGALLELISDHVPIEMKCRIPSRDDD